MLGPYAIPLGDGTVYGNVTLREHHVVRRGDEAFLLRVEEMDAAPLDPALADVLGRLDLLPGTLIPERLMAALRAAGLVDNEAPAAGSAEPAPETPAAGDTAGPATESGAGPKDPAAPWAVRSLALFLAQSCNLACSYCYGDAGSYGAGGLMDARTAREAVEWLFAGSGGSEQVHIGFFGGEPLLNLPVLKEVVTWAKALAADRGMTVRFGITTNATLVSEEVAAFFAREKIDALVSCDGPAAVHDRQRPYADGRGSHADVAAGAQRLREAYPGLMARATLCGETDPFAVRRALEEAGFARCSLAAVSPVLLHERAEREDAAAREARAARVLDYRRAQVARLFETIAEGALDPTAPPPELFLLGMLAGGRKRHTGCGMGRAMRAVAVDGGIYPCHRFVGLEEFRMGELGSYRAGEINDYHRAVVENLPECRSCWARHICGGGCFYENLARSGDMHRPDPLFCAEMRTLAEDITAAWCRLTSEDRVSLREVLEKMDGDDAAP